MSSTYDRMEWVEIIEPRTKEHMYANLKTGDCVWDPPKDVPIKRTNSSQWWELFDTNTQRFYYYNAATQKTVWHRPTKCDIIPLAKLQTLKENSNKNDNIDDSTRIQETVTQHKQNKETKKLKSTPKVYTLPNQEYFLHDGENVTGNTDEKSTPHHRLIFRDVNGDKSSSIQLNELSITHKEEPLHPMCKSNDASLSSKQSDHLHKEGSEYNINKSKTSLQKCEAGSNNGAYGGGDLFFENHFLSKYDYSSAGEEGAKTVDIVNSSIHSSQTSRTPQIKKKHLPDNSILIYPGQSSSQSTSTQKRDNIEKSSQRLEDYRDREENMAIARSGSFMSANKNLYLRSTSYRKSSGEGNGGGGSDDSMHEKYFKSVENTPLSRRRHTSKPSCGVMALNTNSCRHNKNSSDSCPQSPISPINKFKPTKSPQSSIVNNNHKTISSSCNLENVGDRSPCNSEFLNLDKISLHKLSSGPQSDFGVGSNVLSGNHAVSLPHNSALSDSNTGVTQSPSSTKEKHRQNAKRPDKQLPNSIDTYCNNIRENTGRKKGRGRKASYRNPLMTNDGSDAEYENGNISPLYSNSGQEMQSHLLPLKHYIIEQAKLSGRNIFGEPLDSDSYHTDSLSEHSLSGHEPDNEDSDCGSDARGGFLEHNYGMIDDYVNMGDSVSYYAYQYPPYDISGHGDISDNVEAVLEGIESDYGQKSKHCRDYSYHDASTQPPQSPISSKQLQFQSNYEQDQLYSNTSPFISHYNQQPYLSSHQSYGESDLNSKPNQSQTLPSPNRQITRINQSSKEDRKYSGDVEIDNKNLKQSKNENSKIVIQKPIGISTMVRSQQVLSLQPAIEEMFPARHRPPLTTLACMKECDIEKFAEDNLNLHSKGIFRKKSSVRDMLSWTSEAINRPMLALSRDKTEKKIAIELFKLVQIYMGDRKARAGMSLNSVAVDLITSALPQQQLCDELYVQICRQTTENPKRESLIRGWELMVICLTFVPPSPTFQPTLLNYVNRHRDSSFATSFPDFGKWPIHIQISHYATVCCRRLDRIGSSRRQPKKPTEDEVQLARARILHNSMFGNTLSEVMDLQKEKFPFRKLPWIQTTLSEYVLLLHGKETEGIFRVSADVDEVNSLKNRLDRWDVPDYKKTIIDPHAPASLLKLWYRELYDPLIPDELYEECVNTENPERAREIISRLPEINKLVLTYLIHFLQQFSHADVVSCTKMDSSNLAMVFAPNCLRCTSDDPKVILENARKEMAFIRILIQHMNTSEIANME